MNEFHNYLQLKELHKTLAAVNSFSKEMEEKTDQELQKMTSIFRRRIETGVTLDELLPEAYAVVREAARRILGKFPYDVQILGAIALHKEKIIEMKTGEGKTLVAPMPLYLNALTGRSCILVTTNSYLAIRDGEEMRPLYQFLGMSERIGVASEGNDPLNNGQKKQIYASDIVYTTNDALVFDYLFENLEQTKEKRYLRDMYYVIVDEADSVLLDSAQIPLIVSGMPRVQSDLYEVSDYFVTILEKTDYCLGDEKVWLTDSGIRKAESFFRVNSLYDAENTEIVRHLALALRAHKLFQRDEEYIIRDNAIELLDKKSGRSQTRTKLRGGQQQAIEEKEKIELSEESRAVASITYQSYFNMYEKLSGMTGTGASDADEIREIYGLDVVVIPTRKKIKRRDYPDIVFSNREAQLRAALQETLDVHRRAQPVLLVTNSIEMSNDLSAVLLDNGIPHNVLNAYHVAKEAEIIREAGKKNAVTVATAVAGRGTDIRLGEGVCELGGLAVIGVGLMPNLRQELQTRGRSGRQGDPGYSRFYLSLEDDIVVHYGAPGLKKYRIGNKPIKNRRIVRWVHRAQRSGENQARAYRRSTCDFGESMQHQREYMYRVRNQVLNYVETDKEYYLQLQYEVLQNDMEGMGPNYKNENLLIYLTEHISHEVETLPNEEVQESKESVIEYLMKRTNEALDRKLEELQDQKLIEKYLRMMTLRAIDQEWVEQVDYLQQLRQIVSGRQYAGKNIQFEFHQEAYRAFEQMGIRIKSDIMRNILLGELVREKNGGIRVLFP